MDPDSAAGFCVPPSKKPRLEAQTLEAPIPEPEDLIDDMDDLYDSPPALPGSPTKSAPKEPMLQLPSSSVASAVIVQIPGLRTTSSPVQHQVNGNAGESATSLLNSRKRELSTEQMSVDMTSGVQREQGVVEVRDLGKREGIEQGSIVPMSNPQLHNLGESNALSYGNTEHDMGLSSRISMDTVSGKEGLEDAASNLSDPHPLQSIGPLTQENNITNNAEQLQDPVSDVEVTMDTTHERASDPQSIQGIQGTDIKTDHPNGVQQPSSMTTGPAVSKTAEGPTDGDQVLDAEVGLGTNLMELPKVNGVDGEPEFEIDSSPVESLSSDTSTDSSSSDDSDDDYEMLDPKEEARRLMAEDIGSDGEGAGKVIKGTGIGRVRTLNEKPDEIIEKPNVMVTADMKIEELGNVENLVDNLALIRAKISGEYQVLETGSVLCLEDRTVIGVIAETLGRVQQPFYSVRFTNAAAISETGISQGTKIFYVEQHSTYVFTQAIKAIKGSDASNLHDEEVGDDELEFSDDEAEAEHKRRVKMQRQSKRDARTGGDRDGFSKGPRRGGRGNRGSRGSSGFQDRNIQGRVREFNMQHGDAGSINYDDKSDGGELYTPLVRPSNLHEIMGNREAPLESSTITENHVREIRRGNRGRGDRGRGRGDRGRGGRGGRGDARDRGGLGGGGGGDRQAGRSYSPTTHSNGDRSSYTQYDHSQPQTNAFASPASYPQQLPPHYIPAPYHPPLQQQPYSQPPNPPTHYPNAYAQAYPQTQYQQPAPTFYSQEHHPQSQTYYQSQPQPSQPHHQQYTRPPTNPADIPPGAHVNPAFFANADAFGSGRGAGSRR